MNGLGPCWRTALAASRPFQRFSPKYPLQPPGLWKLLMRRRGWPGHCSDPCKLLPSIQHYLAQKRIENFDDLYGSAVCFRSRPAMLTAVFGGFDYFSNFHGTHLVSALQGTLWLQYRFEDLKTCSSVCAGDVQHRVASCFALLPSTSVPPGLVQAPHS